MEDVNEYRQKILDVLLSAKDDAGNPRLSEEAAARLSKSLQIKNCAMAWNSTRLKRWQRCCSMQDWSSMPIDKLRRYE